ncbi:MAG: hypothetical protein AB7P56_05865 [Nitrososphaeraceae archaeon]
MGQIIGFDSLGTRKTFSAYAPENHDNTIFGSTRKYDNESQRIFSYTTGPIKQETVYTLDYSPENVQILYEKSWNGKNIFFKPDKKGNRRVMFIIKDESTSTAVEVYWQSIERSLELMKTKTFAELFNGSYLPPAVKEERLRMSQGLTGEFNKPNPTVPEHNTNFVNNTSAYK